MKIIQKDNHNDIRLKAGALKLAQGLGFHGNASMERLAGGRNNQVFKMTVDDRHFLIKSYFMHEDDPRDRLGSEFSFLRFAWDKGIRCIPQPLAADIEQHVALYEFIEGKRLINSDINDDLIERAVNFIRELNTYRQTEDAEKLPLASEACLSIAEHLNAVERRLNRLSEVTPSDLARSNAHDFIQGELIPCWLKMKRNILEQFSRHSTNAMDDIIDNSECCISPSDFGFHNTLLEQNGDLRFIDFEYAGWDDPVKLISDFICQPELPISDNAGLKFMEDVVTSFDQHKFIRKRFEQLFRVHRLKWCCILLNEFKSEDMQRRCHAGVDSANILESQLDKAMQYFRKHRTNLI